MKHAFSLIEAVICIIILGIIMLWLPMPFFTTSKNTQTALLEQSIMDTKMLMNLALRLPFGCINQDSEIISANKIPIFGNLLDNFKEKDTFYSKNGIKISMSSRRYFAPIAPANKCSDTKYGDINSLNEEKFITKIDQRQGILLSKMQIFIANNTIDANNDKNYKEIKIKTQATSNESEFSKQIELRGYALNIGSTPQILVKSLK
jgi:hypothetical protein